MKRVRNGKRGKVNTKNRVEGGEVQGRGGDCPGPTRGVKCQRYDTDNNYQYTATLRYTEKKQNLSTNSAKCASWPNHTHYWHWTSFVVDRQISRQREKKTSPVWLHHDSIPEQELLSSLVACTVVERRSVTGELSLSYARPAADGWPLMGVNRPIQGQPTRPTQTFILSRSINE